MSLRIFSGKWHTLKYINSEIKLMILKEFLGGGDLPQRISILK